MLFRSEGNTVPFFTVIFNAVQKYIPDLVPPGTPNFDRFGNKKALRKVVYDADFKKIKVKEHYFFYKMDSFADFWQNYLKYVAKPVREKINKLSKTQLKEVREVAKQNSLPYTKKNGKLVFPWKVLILTAKSN